MEIKRPSEMRESQEQAIQKIIKIDEAIKFKRKKVNKEKPQSRENFIKGTQNTNYNSKTE